MAEYVTKEQVLDWFRPYGHMDDPIPFETMVSDLRGMPAADVTPVLHGRWIKYQIPPIICCSNCDWATDVEEKNFQYCPNCGADMRGSNDE